MNGRFFSEFLDDYFAECDEHLAAMRQQLLALETAQADERRTVVNDLLRSFHSLKGLSAMVGFDEISELAHQTEEYLRNLAGLPTLPSGAMDVLIFVAGILEQAVGARRNQQMADVSPAMGRLQDLLAQSDAPSPSAPEAVPTRRTRWRVIFAPTQELAARNINVNVLRTRLRELGTIEQAAPLVSADGSISFEFVLAVGGDANIGDILESEGFNSRTTRIEAERSTSPSEPAATAAPQNIVRVDMARLDDLMRIVGELVISRARLTENLNLLTPERLSLKLRDLQDINDRMELQLRDLREAVMRVRMVPMRQVFERMRFLVRSLEHENTKEIELETIGEETEIDKHVVERMMDPLLHLVRNAASHGLESNAERIKSGKPARGTITLRAFTAADTITIEIADDGRGVDVEAVRNAARQAGLLGAPGSPNDELPRNQVLELLCHPGLTTRKSVDMESGRGMGMSVVKGIIDELGGTLSLHTEQGRGTRFSIALPLTLAITEALVVSTSDQKFAVPQVFVREVMRIEPEAMRTMEKNELVPYRGGTLPIVRLHHVFGLASQPRKSSHVLVIGNNGNSVGLFVDRIIGQREIVVRGITDPLLRVPGVTGATELGDGKPILILDPRVLVNEVRKRA